MAKWFTSDNHFGHKSILKFCPKTRLGQDVTDHINSMHQAEHADYTDRFKLHQNYVRQMDSKMIKIWNETVASDDEVFCLGDFSFYKSSKTASILAQLNGKKHLIKGNHDHYVDAVTSGYFESIQDYLELKIDGKHVVMFHFPILEWNKIHHGSYHLYGHVHGGTQIAGRAMDVGIDARPNGDMKPWSWQEIDEILSKREILTHHGKLNT